VFSSMFSSYAAWSGPTSIKYLLSYPDECMYLISVNYGIWDYTLVPNVNQGWK
jgi:hypothetical protein